MTTSAATELFDPALFKQAMRHLAGAVSVVTVGEGEDRTGFTATSVSSFSADPPSILVCLNRSSSSWEALQRYRRFCVNILAAEHDDVAQRFAGAAGVKGASRYEGATWQKLSTGALSLAGALTVIDCELDESIDRHSHSILIGRVQAVASRSEAQPLLYWRGSYRQLAPAEQPAAEALRLVRSA